ncbi:uncharacterized protein AB675_1329 [Cyphellophora attinorum]|uniref:NmrA-like domain-containing protein n=1 Tax=Cyphellophora attinorum TaxID=1664694 RepID=A0A0N1NVN9_9EURO|nr:uncharacterized protein AB675_1329 [Phialophora attinorum]KPI35086.1 hypothetical protein AB675_1329 [Phialophora attinorum]
MAPTFLVTGATGNQGGAVVKHLLAAGAAIHAVVRDVSSVKAQKLKEQGVALFQGTHEEPDEVFREAAMGCTGLFLNPSVFDPSIAKSHATAIINATKSGSSSLTTIVLSSTLRANEMHTQLPLLTTIDPSGFLAAYYTAKHAVEEAVRKSGVPNITILRPGVLYHDYLPPWSTYVFPELVSEGLLPTRLDEGIEIAHGSADDVGKFAAAALLDPGKFRGKEIDLVSESLTAEEAARVLGEVGGRSIAVKRGKATGNMGLFHLLSNKQRKEVDVEALEEKWGIGLVRFREFLEENRERLLKGLPKEGGADGSAK